jgi:hypothetical protein
MIPLSGAHCTQFHNFYWLPNANVWFQCYHVSASGTKCQSQGLKLTNIKLNIFESLGVSTVETNRDWDQLLKPVQIILTVETSLFFVSVKIRLHQDFHWDCRDFHDLLRLFKINQDISTLSRLFEGLQAKKSWQIEKSRSRRMIKSTHSQSRPKQTVKIYLKFQVFK